MASEPIPEHNGHRFPPIPTRHTFFRRCFGTRLSQIRSRDPWHAKFGAHHKSRRGLQIFRKTIDMQRFDLGATRLLRQSGESLAGRIAQVELTPFRLSEVGAERISQP